jgi:hypothetical protein
LVCEDPHTPPPPPPGIIFSIYPFVSHLRCWHRAPLPVSFIRTAKIKIKYSLQLFTCYSFRFHLYMSNSYIMKYLLYCTVDGSGYVTRPNSKYHARNYLFQENWALCPLWQLLYSCGFFAQISIIVMVLFYYRKTYALICN